MIPNRNYSMGYLPHNPILVSGSFILIFKALLKDWRWNPHLIGNYSLEDLSRIFSPIIFSIDAAGHLGGRFEPRSMKTHFDYLYSKRMGLPKLLVGKFFPESKLLAGESKKKGGRACSDRSFRWGQTKEITSFSLDAQRKSGLRSSPPLS
jgi:hypothetical protein